MTDAAYALYVHLKTKVCVIRSEECLILGTWYQSLASISSPGCFLSRPLRLCGETQALGSYQDRAKRRFLAKALSTQRIVPKASGNYGNSDARKLQSQKLAFGE
jgi:hypothetical protein